MSALLAEIITARKAKAVEYEEYLKRIAELAKQVETGQAEEMPENLDTPGKRALYNNLQQHGEGLAVLPEERTEYTVAGNPAVNLALRIDEAVRRVRPDEWRGVQPREQVIKAELYKVVDCCTLTGCSCSVIS